jgi:hypothetical protein
LAINSAVIGGSGPSLSTCDTTRIPKDAYIFRTNNFFLEREYNLGQKVDCVYFSGDKRAIRFYAATLRKVMRLDIYQIDKITSHHHGAPALNFKPKIVEPFVVHNDRIRALIADQHASSGILPTSGIMAAINAYQLGAKNLYLAGFDFYQGEEKYSTPLPPRLNSILEPNMSPLGYDSKLHSHKLDFQILELLQQLGTNVFDTSPLSHSTLPKAPRLEEHLKIGKKHKPIQINDWVGFDGLYPLAALLALRKLRRFKGAPQSE